MRNPPGIGRVHKDRNDLSPDAPGSERKNIIGHPAILPGDAVHHALEVRLGIDRDRYDLGFPFLFGSQQISQLAELTGAVRSPISSVKDQHHIF